MSTSAEKRVKKSPEKIGAFFKVWQIVKFKLNILVDRKTHKGL